MSEKEILLYAGLLPHLNRNLSCVTLRANLLQENIQLPESVEEIAKKAAAISKNPLIFIGECVACVLTLEISRIIVQQYSQTPILILLNPWHPGRERSNNNALSAVEQYYQSLCTFNPAKYPGKIHLILAEDREDSIEHCYDWWSAKTATQCELHLVPGDSQTYIRLHRKCVAEIINQLVKLK